MANQYALSLYTDIQNRFSVDSSNMPMSDWICKNTTLRGVPFSFRKFPFQKQIVDDMHPNLCVTKISQIGLALDLNTPVPTPTGWSTMGELREGDLVYAPNGKPTRVTYVSPVYHDHACYELTFCDGEKIVADANHRWEVHSDRMFNQQGFYPASGRIPKAVEHEYGRSGVLTTEVIARSFKRGQRHDFFIPVAAPLEQSVQDSELPLDPYFLGLWLGNGHAYSSNLSIHTQDLPEITASLQERGFSCRVTPDSAKCVVVKAETPEGTPKTFNRLSTLGVLKNKHIPQPYLRASLGARLELLKGLIDTDGSITESGRVSFHNTNVAVIEGTLELLRSLGFKPHIRWRPPAAPSVLENGLTITPKLPIAEVHFIAYAETPVSGLARKRARQRVDGRRTETGRRRIVNIQAVPTRPVRCITVEDPSHLFLAGRAMVATHNTETQIRKAAAFVTRNRGVTLLFTFPSEDMQKRTSQTRIQPLITENSVFNRAKDSGMNQIRSVGIIQIETSFLLVTSCTEGEATSTPADAVFNDEVDLSDPGILALFSSRMQASDWKIRQQFSTPTFSGYGIDQTYEVSDQHEYLLKCDSCNHWQLPLFTKKFVRLPGLPDSTDLTEIDQAVLDNNRIDLDLAYVACERCGAELDLGRADNRNWVSKYPHRTNARGYRVRPFSVNTLPPKYIIEKMLEYKRNGFMRGWYNTVLGETYEDGDIRLTDVQINACFEPGHPDRFRDVDPTRTPLFLGIDLGLVCHITVLAPRDRRVPRLQDMEVVCFEAIPVDLLIERVKWYQQNFLIVGGGTDRHPFAPTANALYDATGGIVVPYEYRGGGELKEKLDSDKTIQINRTMAIDTVAQLVRSSRVTFSGYGDQKEIIHLHLKNMVREETPEKPAVWKKLGGPSAQDHYFHAVTFAYSALRFYLGDFVGSEASLDKRQTVWVAPANTTATAVVSGLTSVVGSAHGPSRGRQATVGFNRLR